MWEKGKSYSSHGNFSEVYLRFPYGHGRSEYEVLYLDSNNSIFPSVFVKYVYVTNWSREATPSSINIKNEVNENMQLIEAYKKYGIKNKVGLLIGTLKDIINENCNNRKQRV